MWFLALQRRKKESKSTLSQDDLGSLGREKKYGNSFDDSKPRLYLSPIPLVVSWTLFYCLISQSISVLKMTALQSAGYHEAHAGQRSHFRRYTALSFLTAQHYEHRSNGLIKDPTI